MKKTYMIPVSSVVEVKLHKFVCTSIAGVEGTGNMKSCVSNEETDSYLSRRASSAWDEY